MKMGIVGSRGLPPRYGGYETFTSRLVPFLTKEGFEVIVYTLSTLKKEPYNFPGVHRVFITVPPVKALEKLCLSVFSTFRAAFVEKVDVILYLGVSGGIVMWIPKLLGIPTAVNTDGLEWKRSRWPIWGRWFLKLLERLSVKFADKVIADSMAIGDYLKKEYGVESTFIAYGCSECVEDDKSWEELKRTYNIESGGYYLVVGRAVPENNYSVICEGFLKSNSRKKLIFVTNEVPDWLKVASDKVIYAGPIYDSLKLNTLRKNAFAYIHGHSVGGTNPSLLEAISCENLVIAYDVPFNREVLGDFALYFKDSASLSQIINSLENGNVPYMEEIRAYYKSIRAERYNWEKVGEAYVRLIREIAQYA